MGRRTTPVNMGEPAPETLRSPPARGGSKARCAPPDKADRPRSSTPAADTPERSLRPLLRDLLNHAASHAATESRPEPACDDAGAQVLLDVEVDGARYQLLRSVTPPATPEPALPPHHAGLSPREQEIVRMVALGHPNKTIAAVLEISCWTVGTYLRRIFAKLNVGSRAAMVARVMEKADLSRHPPHPTPRAPITAAPTDARPHPRPTPVEPRPTGDRAPTAEPRYLYR